MPGGPYWVKLWLAIGHVFGTRQVGKQKLLIHHLPLLTRFVRLQWSVMDTFPALTDIYIHTRHLYIANTVTCVYKYYRSPGWWMCGVDGKVGWAPPSYLKKCEDKMNESDESDEDDLTCERAT